jgi:hypothetical protein
MNYSYSENKLLNKTANTAAGINTPKGNERSGPMDMFSGAVEKIVDNVQHAFGGEGSNDDIDELDVPEQDHHDHLRHKHKRYDRHSY